MAEGDIFRDYEDAATRWLRGDAPFIADIIEIDEDDDAAPADDDINDDFVAPMGFDMRYRNASGAVSLRRVKLIKLRQTLSEIYLCCYCFKRNGYCDFKLGNILEVIDIATGEVFPSGRAFLEECGAIPAETPESQAMAICAHDLTVLAFLGSCDGRFLPVEVDEIVKHIGLSIDFDVDEGAIRRAVSSLMPDARAFRSALRRFEGDDARRRALVRAVRNVINADRVAHENEIAIGGQILKALGVDLT